VVKIGSSVATLSVRCADGNGNELFYGLSPADPNMPQNQWVKKSYTITNVYPWSRTT